MRDKQLLAALPFSPTAPSARLAIASPTRESEGDWGIVLDDLKARGLRSVELIVVDGTDGFEPALTSRLSDVPIQRFIMHIAHNVMADQEENRAEIGPT